VYVTKPTYDDQFHRTWTKGGTPHRHRGEFYVRSATGLAVVTTDR